MCVLMYLFDWYREAWVVSFDVFFNLFGWIIYELGAFSIGDISDLITHHLIGKFFIDPSPLWCSDTFWVSGVHLPWIYDSINIDSLDLPF